MLDLLQRCIWKASGVGCVCQGVYAGTMCSQDLAWNPGPRGQQLGLPGGIGIRSPSPHPGPDEGGAWRVDFKPQLGLNLAQLLYAEDTRRTLPEPIRHPAQRSAVPGPFSLRGSELDWFSIPGAVWLELRQCLQLPKCPERLREFPDGPSSFG